MYVHVDLLSRALRESLLRRPFRWRRWAYVLFFSMLFALMWGIVAIGRALDLLLFPGFKKQKVEQPIFIVAPPRSGTTLTQKLMAQDEEQFAHVKLFHTIFPAITFSRIFQGLAKLDDWSGGQIMHFARWLEGCFFSGWDSTHPLRFTEPEEDDGFFVYSGITEAIYLLFPYVNELWEAGFADALPVEKRRKLMKYYRSCLQRHLYACGDGRTLLSKATQFSGSVEALLEEFPDARLVTLVRDPYQSIASHVSVFYPAWHQHSPEIKRDSPESRAYAQLAAEWYKHLFAFKDKIAANQYYCLNYQDLVADHFAAISGIYAHFGLTMGDAARYRLGEAAGRASQFRSRHAYCLEDYGLDRAWLHEELGEIMTYYGLDADASKSAEVTARATGTDSVI